MGKNTERFFNIIWVPIPAPNHKCEPTYCSEATPYFFIDALDRNILMNFYKVKKPQVNQNLKYFGQLDHSQDYAVKSIILYSWEYSNCSKYIHRLLCFQHSKILFFRFVKPPSNALLCYFKNISPSDITIIPIKFNQPEC